ncbi:MAG: lytic transglycosylase domain-containing protein, partial [Thermoanaerobaculia bacterium]|nr:lytic transglycosylase domain-containing protein [Thermoanaerobaculia bacterium]
YWDEIRSAAAEQEIDPFLMAAIIRQESGWDPSIISSAGAVGLMQMMPKEAAAFGELAGLGREVTRQDLFDARINLKVGAAEIREKLDAMNGNQLLAIASYNAGENAVRSWTRKTPTEDRDLFIDSIPYSETRLYVMVVTRNLYEYRRIYGQPGEQGVRTSR